MSIFGSKSRIAPNEARCPPNPEIGAMMYAYVHPSGFNALVWTAASRYATVGRRRSTSSRRSATRLQYESL